MSRLVIGSRAALIAALRKQRPSPARAERARALLEELFLDALFLVAQLPGGQIAEAEKCCYAYDVRRCAGLCRAAWAEEAFWSGLVRVRAGPRKRTRLMYAADRGDAARVAWQLARGAPREAEDSFGWTALFYASMHGHINVVRTLIAAGANIDANHGASPLWIATRDDHIEIMRIMLAAGANVEAAGGYSSVRPLYIASMEGNVAAATLLLDAGADVNARINDGRSPLAIATMPEMRALLVARGGM